MQSIWAPGSLLANRFRLQREVGRGAFGQVFLARDEREDGPVAVKIMSVVSILSAVQREEVRKRFSREVKIGRQLVHPRIVPLLESCEHRGFPLLIFEYAEGQTLEATLKATRTR